MRPYPAEPANWCALNLPAASAPNLLPDPREEIILRRFRIYYGPSQMIVLRRPRLLLEADRAGEPATVRVDLGGVGEQRLVPDREVFAARHQRGDLEGLPSRLVGVGVGVGVFWLVGDPLRVGR